METFTSKGLIFPAYIGRPDGPHWCLWEHNTRKLLKVFNSFEKCINFVYPDCITYHRKPTQYELKAGYGAIHYKDFSPIDCVNKHGKLKKWIICKFDGLRYYR